VLVVELAHRHKRQLVPLATAATLLLVLLAASQAASLQLAARAVVLVWLLLTYLACRWLLLLVYSNTGI
jgi:hypothetical protein